MLNGLCGILSIYSSVLEQYNLAVLFLILSFIWDGLDGGLAKKLKVTSKIGAELDSLNDAISFGVAPMALLNSLFRYDLILIAVSTFFSACAIYRLARYNITPEDKNKKEFEGVPTTANAFIIPLLYYLNIPITAYYFIIPILGLLMISKIKIKRIL